MNTTVVEFMPPIPTKKLTDSAVPGSGHITSDRSEILTVQPSTSSGTGRSTKIFGDPVDKAGLKSLKPKVNAEPSSCGGGEAATKGKALKSGGKRQRSGDTQVSEGKRLKPSTSFPSAPELEVAIVDRSHPEGRMAADRWLILEEHILRALVGALAHSDDDSFTAFDGAKWQNGVKIIGCGNEKAVKFLKSSIQGFDKLWPGMNIDVVPIDQIPYYATVKVWVPPPILEDESILTLLKRE